MHQKSFWNQIVTLNRIKTESWGAWRFPPAVLRQTNTCSEFLNHFSHALSGACWMTERLNQHTLTDQANRTYNTSQHMTDLLQRSGVFYCACMLNDLICKAAGEEHFSAIRIQQRSDLTLTSVFSDLPGWPLTLTSFKKL